MAYDIGTNVTSSNMAQKVLSWSTSQLNNWCSFHVPMFIFRRVHVFESEFASGIKDVTFMFIYIYDL